MALWCCGAVALWLWRDGACFATNCATRGAAEHGETTATLAEVASAKKGRSIFQIHDTTRSGRAAYMRAQQPPSGHRVHCIAHCIGQRVA